MSSANGPYGPGPQPPYRGPQQPYPGPPTQHRPGQLPPGGPQWARPPQPPQHGGNRLTIILITVVAVLLVGAVIAWVIALRPVATAADGGDGVGDPYYPRMGGGGYDAQRYAIDVTWEDTQDLLMGTTTITARATEDLGTVHFDLALTVDEVTQGTKVTEFAQDGQDISVKLADPVSAGEEFQLTVRYAGNPGQVDEDGFYNTDGEVVVADEPSSAPLWFPSNDHPSDPAQMDVTLRVRQGKQAISVGRLESQRTEGNWDVWHWVSSQPMATYLNFFAIGDYTIEQGEANGRPYVYAVSEKLPDPKTAMETLRTTPDVVAELEQLYGPYPFSEIGGVVPNTDFPFGALENQTRPVYRAGSLLAEPRQLLVHETAHMWFGNNVTLREWNDIFINEAFATHAEWLADEQAGDGPANAYLDAYYDRFPEQAWQVRLSDPGTEDLFHQAVYLRGGMTLQALRNVLGDDTFLSLVRDWAQRPGARSLEDFRAFAQERSQTDLTAFFTAWVDSPTKPDRTPENGFID